MINVFVGTTAELIKVFPLMVELNRKKIQYRLISSGQNDIRHSELFDLFDLERPDIVFTNSSHKQSALGLIIWFISTLVRGYNQLRKLPRTSSEVMVVHGDTVSTVMGAMLGRLLKMKVAHVEAGLRSYNYLNPFPEEIDRVITSRLASIHYAPNDWSCGNLGKVKGEVVNTQENTLIDALRLANEVKTSSPDFMDKLQSHDYFVFVVHRQENLFDSDFVKWIVERCIEESKKTHCVLVLHELTRIKLEELGLLEILEKAPDVTLIPRQPYVQFMKVLSACSYMVTDGGSNQEESYYLGKPCLILRTHTERVEGLDKNVIISNKEKTLINKFFDNIDGYRLDSKLNTERPSETIAQHLSELAGKVR
ncbi:UDP-N-acetyl glucosamine 2-epimerase [Vibrio sp. JC009]|uniref:UDP-N-acetylglucosamine 2-epimerase n=1 Tax=Vibrio sp. JC009 TaxID=2912314 RepID=UPI0023B123CD|nr:UDP-N-acetylglucosamine 2-epimerase [Vibrio sp. JC009]WED22002.1 UDP-N-acetyl glucosamine 2-epimerase [Vibrio sp. JC009]